MKLNNPFVTRYQGGFIKYHWWKIDRWILNKIPSKPMSRKALLITGIVFGFIMGVML